MPDARSGAEGCQLAVGVRRHVVVLHVEQVDEDRPDERPDHLRGDVAGDLTPVELAGQVPIYGFYLEGNEAMRPIMDAYLRPFQDYTSMYNTQQGIGATDHLSFLRTGMPGYQAIHDYTDYDVRTHHTNMDTFDRIDEEGLVHAAVVMASILYHAAMRDEKMPRDPTWRPGR